MALQTLTTLTNVLQNVYDPVIRDQRNKKSILVDKIEKNVGVQAMANNNFYIKTRSTHHSGWYFDDGAAGASLNTGAPSYNEMTVPARYGYGTHQITDSALTAMAGKPGAIVDVASDFATAVKDELRKEKNRQWLGLGGTEANNASLATISVSTTGTGLTVYNGSGTPNDQPGLGTRFLHPGDVLAIGTDAEQGAGTTIAATVSTVDSITGFTITASQTVVISDNVVKGTGANAATGFATSDNNEMNGMKNIVSASNTFQNIARSSNFWGQAYLDNTAEALSENAMVSAFLEAEDRNGEPNVVIAGLIMFTKYASLLTSMKRTANSVESLLGGFTGLEFASGGPGVAVLLDRDCSYGDVWFPSLTSDYIAAGELASGWLGADQGTSIFQKTNLAASFWATYKFYGNLCVRGMSAHSGLRRKTA